MTQLPDEHAPVAALPLCDPLPGMDRGDPSVIRGGIPDGGTARALVVDGGRTCTLESPAFRQDLALRLRQE